MGKRKWITRAEIKEILKTYSILPDAFEPMEKLDNYYKNKYADGCIIAINPEEIHGRDIVEQTDRILVRYCDSGGYIMYTDIWERLRNGKMQRLCRQEKGELPDSAAYVNDLREELERLLKKNKDLQQQLSDVNTNNAGESDTAELRELLDAAINERDHYKKLYQDLKNEIAKKKKNVGRKKRGESSASRDVLESVRNVLNNDPENKEPWKVAGISRPTYFRYKKLIKDEK